MKEVDKFLLKLTREEREEILRLVERIIAKDFRGLDYKKLKGAEHIFRVRKGNFRIIFESHKGTEPIILSIDRRSEDTYKF